MTKKITRMIGRFKQEMDVVPLKRFKNKLEKGTRYFNQLEHHKPEI